jgi:hypothetical protein
MTRDSLEIQSGAEAVATILAVIEAALIGIATTQACANSDPDLIGRELDRCVGLAQGALRNLRQAQLKELPPVLGDEQPADGDAQ